MLTVTHELPDPQEVDALTECGYPHEAALALANHVDPYRISALTLVRGCPRDLAARIAAYDEVPTLYYGSRRHF